MKRGWIFLCLLMLVLVAEANPVDVKRAKATALKVLGGTDVHSVAMVQTGETRRAADAAEPAYYVFVREEGAGFVIVSGDDALPELVAYSDQTSFPSEGEIHPALSGFLDTYASMVEAVRNGEEVVTMSQRVDAAVPVVEPLCKTQWSQGNPYNALCPLDEGKRSMVGCVALAMAQIMKYHEWPLHGTGKVSYTPSTVKELQVVDFSQSTYQWKVMLNTTAELKADAEAAEAVAKLCYDCGVSSRMEYGAEESGTYDDYAIQSMYENFGYKASTIQILYRDCFATQQEWNAIWKAELDAGRPILYSGLSKSGGHEFIIDGYDSNGFVHVNWGWGGDFDAFYDIAILDATPAMSFTDAQAMIVGIEPDYTGTDRVHAPVIPFMASSFSLSKSVTLNKDRLINVKEIYNRSRSAQTWFFGVGLFDVEGNMLANLTKNETSHSIPSMKGLTQTMVIFNIPSNTPDGEYVLSVIFRPKNSDEWLFPNVVGGAGKNRVYVKVHDGVADVHDGTVPIYNICVDDEDSTMGEVVSHQYYDMMGRPLKNAPKGVVLEVKTFSNGEKRTRKVLF
ncbi:MAG: C10 family peptidase [Bacteroidaceae bacterium]|nr:C10 family peptidase [Bacteroidaceae bacterium]